MAMGYLKKDSRYLLRTAHLLLLIPCVLMLLLYGLWYIAIPAEMIEDKIEGSFLDRGIKVEIEGLRKGLFYSLTIERMKLYTRTADSNPSELLTLSSIVARFDFSSLLRLSPSLTITASLGGGSLKGNLSILNKQLNLDIEGVEFGELRFLSDKGITGRGTVSASLSLSLNGTKGDVRFGIADAALRDFEGGGYIPLSLFNSIRGVIEFSNNAINIRSLSFEGKGIFGRVQGLRLILPETGRNLGFSGDSKMELMINSDFSIPQIVDLGLFRYKRSPGYYIIPLNDVIKDIRVKG